MRPIHILKPCPSHDVNESVASSEKHSELKFDGNNSKRSVVNAFKNPVLWLKSLRKQEWCDGVGDVTDAIDAEELKSAMTKLMMVLGAVAAVNHDDDQRSSS